MINKQELHGKVCDTLAVLTLSTRLRSAGGDLGVNHAAEDFYCGLLNIILESAYPGIRLENMNRIQDNYPAIDLGDRDRGVAVQITTTEHRGKINHTLDKFFENDLDAVYQKKLIILIIGKKDEFKKDFAVQRGYDFVHTRDVWDTDRLGREIGSLGPQSMERVYDYLCENLSMIPSGERGLRLPFSAMDRNAFVGREQELQMLSDRTADQKNNVPIFVTGLGGMGKTELVARFCTDYQGGRTYFVRFRENFTQTVAMGVASGMEGYKERKPDLERDYAEAMTRLQNCAPGDILVIDNADEPEGNFGRLQTDPTWSELRKLKLRLILTTRCEVAGAIRVEQMRNETLYRLFENQGLPLDQKQMDALVDAVNGHTMTVDLMARTLKRSRTLTVEKLLEALGAGDLKKQNYRAVALERNGEVAQEVIYEHLRRLFNVAEISEDARAVLRNMVLLPEDGMDIGILEAVLDEEKMELLEQQIDHGWLGFEEDTKFVTIHPVIRLVCREELKPDDDNCGKLLNAVWDYYDPNKYDAEIFKQFAELFSRAAELLPDGQGKWAIRAGYFWKEIGQAGNALGYEEQAVRRLEESQPDSEALAMAYNNLGITYGSLGDHGKELEYQLKALEIRETVLPSDHPDLAQSYNNLGMTYNHLGDYNKELEYVQKALSIWEEVFPSEHPNLATSYNNVGLAYSNLGNPKRALECVQKAMEIQERAYPENHPDLAATYNNVGWSYGACGDYNKALEYVQKALSIWKKVLPANHPNLATSYDNVGYTYNSLGEYKKAMECLRQALVIREKALPPNHPSLAASYNNVGCAYAAQTDYETAMEYVKKALEIAEISLPKGHPYTETYRRSVNILELLISVKKLGVEVPNPFREK